MAEQEKSPFVHFSVDLRRGHSISTEWQRRRTGNTEYGGVLGLRQYMDAVYDRYLTCCRLTGEPAKKKSEWLLEGLSDVQQESNTGGCTND